MAASDYTIKNDGPLCPVAQLAGTILPLATTMTVTGFQATGTDDIVIGMAVMIDDEILRVVDNAGFPVIGIARGCADTIPKQHSAGTTVWFFDDAVVSDDKEYTATDTIAVKGLVFTGSGGAVPIEEAPPVELTLDWRAFRPYPPGLFLVEGTPWFDGVKVPTSGDNLSFTFAHRDRILQADQLIDHSNASIGPEPGTTYVAKAYTPDGTLVNTYDGITGDVWSYSELDAQADFPAGEGYIDFYSSREGMLSWQFYRIQIAWGSGGGGGPRMLVSIDAPTGLGDPNGTDYATYIAQVDNSGTPIMQASLAHEADYRSQSIFPYNDEVYVIIRPRTGSAATFTKGFRTLMDGFGAETTIPVQIWAAAISGDKLIGISYKNNGNYLDAALSNFYVLEANAAWALLYEGSIGSIGAIYVSIAANGAEFISGGVNHLGTPSVVVHNHETDTFVRELTYASGVQVHSVAMSDTYYAVLYEAGSPTLDIYERSTGDLLHTETFSSGEYFLRQAVQMTDSRVILSRTAGNAPVGANAQIEVYAWDVAPTPTLTLLGTPASPFSGSFATNDIIVYNHAAPYGGAG